MKLTPATQSVILQFAQKFPLPKTNDDDAANWTHKLCEQLAFAFPAAGWGHKSAGPGRPHSADCIAIAYPFTGWDIVFSAGSPQAALNPAADSIDLSGQVFEPVAAVNHLAPEETPVPPQDTPQPPAPQEPPAPPAFQALVLEALAGILAELRAQRASVDAVAKSLPDIVKAGIKIRF